MTVRELYERIDGSYESALRILRTEKLVSRFIVKFPDDASFARMAEAWERRDPQGAFEGAHALKGVCANLGLNCLSAAASDLAEEFRPGRRREMDDEEVTLRVAALRADYERTKESIRAFAAEQQAQ